MSEVAALLREALRPAVSEADLRTQVVEALEPVLGAGLLPEYDLGAHGRPDFFVGPTGEAIELKVQGGFSAVMRQLLGYAMHAETQSLLLVTTRAAHRDMPPILNGKPVDVVWVQPW